MLRLAPLGSLYDCVVECSSDRRVLDAFIAFTMVPPDSNDAGTSSEGDSAFRCSKDDSSSDSRWWEERLDEAYESNRVEVEAVGSKLLGDKVEGDRRCDAGVARAEGEVWTWEGVLNRGVDEAIDPARLCGVMGRGMPGL